MRRRTSLAAAAAVLGGCATALAPEPPPDLSGRLAVRVDPTAATPGRFNVVGTMIGVLFVAASVSGLTLSGADDWVQPVFNGAALVVAVVLSTFLARRRSGADAP